MTDISKVHIKINLSKKNWFLSLSFFLLIILSQVILLNVINNINIIIGFNCFLAVVAFLTFLDLKAELQLLILAILPLIIVNYNFGRSFQYIVLQNITLTIFAFFALFKFLYEYEAGKNKNEKLFVLIFIFTGYSIFLSIRGILSGAPVNFVFNEFYQNFYFFLPIPIYYLIRDRYSYKALLITIVFVFLIIAIEFFVISYSRGTRFLSFQYLFFPFIIGTLFGLIFLYKNNVMSKIFYLILFLIVWLGSIATAARTMWVANLLTIFFIVFFYQRYVKKNLKIFFLVTIFLLTLTIPFIIKSDNAKVSSLPTSTEERMESISNPTGDTSFLMRVEASFLAIQKFIQHPLIGEGYGRHIKFKWLLSTQVIYLDNSFLYFLWKGGLIGLMLVLLLYFVFIKDTLFVIKNSNKKDSQLIAIIILSSFIAFLFEGILSANLIGFKLNYLYAIAFAYIIFEKKNIVNG